MVTDAQFLLIWQGVSRLVYKLSVSYHLSEPGDGGARLAQLLLGGGEQRAQAAHLARGRLVQRLVVLVFALLCAFAARLETNTRSSDNIIDS